MTSKGQVTVPKDIRDLLGLDAGSVVSFAVDKKGEVKLSKSRTDSAQKKKRKEIRDGIARAQALFAKSNRFPGMSTDDYMAMIREPIQSFEKSGKA